jgi:hypothetical protein
MLFHALLECGDHLEDGTGNPALREDLFLVLARILSEIE